MSAAATGTSSSGDTTAPTVNTSLSVYSSSITMNANATDASGVSKVEFYIDGQKKGQDYAPGWSMSMSTASWWPGSTHTYTIKAYDPANGDYTGMCMPFGLIRSMNAPYPFQIMQLPDRVVFVYEYMHNFRIIYTDGRSHRESWEPSLMGDSIGRWEGDTLVIDTVNLTDRTRLDDHGNVHSDALHVIERWRRISANELWYEATIDDPQTFSRPWTISMPLYRHIEADARLLEFNCVEYAEQLLYGDLMTTDPAAAENP